MHELQRTVITRSGEVDSRQRIPPAVMGRYHEYVRSQAFAAAPELGLTALVSQGYTAVVRAQHLAMGQPVVQNEELTLTMQIGSVGRTSIAFAHTAQRASDGAVVSRARAVVVVLGPDRRPAQVPESIRMAVQTVDMPEPLEPAGSAPLDAWSRTIQVRPSDLDSLQHVNQARYLDFFDDTMQLAQVAGVYGDVGGELQQISIDYQREAKLGRDLTCLTWRQASGVLGFALNDADGVTLAQASILQRNDGRRGSPQ